MQLPLEASASCIPTLAPEDTPSALFDRAQLLSPFSQPLKLTNSQACVLCALCPLRNIVFRPLMSGVLSTQVQLNAPGLVLGLLAVATTTIFQIWQGSKQKATLPRHFLDTS